MSSYKYDTFGKLVAQNGAFNQPFLYSTKRNEAEIGVNYYGYRFYAPNIGRWMNRDPLGEAGGVNLYGFVGGDPINWIDPDGFAKGKNKGGAGLNYNKKDKKKGSEGRQKSGERERNVGHPKGEEHSRVPKGSRGSKYQMCGEKCQKTLIWTGFGIVAVCCALQPEICFGAIVIGGSLAY